MPLRSTRYPATPWLSVPGAQDSVSEVPLEAVTVGVPGVVGAVWSVDPGGSSATPWVLTPLKLVNSPPTTSVLVAGETSMSQVP